MKAIISVRILVVICASAPGTPNTYKAQASNQNMVKASAIRVSAPLFSGEAGAVEVLVLDMALAFVT
ncbi:hypothetical protein GCM10011498_15840 [Amylibacter cionae]|uniref:Uncharacterized protein n=1 Tax=Neptunicoccus cionae TaxID=2035344 RepID=A0A916VPU0_9RHOB|nr:hypothetical protein GCM10011498_15840 [Amylibacter cionae]